MDDSEPLAPPADPVAPASPAPAPDKARSARATRLAAALRDNLKRRKLAGRPSQATRPSN